MEESFWTNLESRSTDLLITIGIKLIYAAVVLFVGLLLIKLLMKMIKGIMNRANTDLALRSFIESLSIALLYTFLVFSIGLALGIKVSAFMTLIGAAGIAIGLALQGSLSNFAGGVLILLFKPFKVGDEVLVNGVEGEIDSINILYTRIHNWRGEYYSMPNGEVSNNVVKNSTTVEYRRVHVELHFSFEEDIDELREIVIETLKKHPRVNQNKPFQFRVNNFQDYYIKTSARCWCKSDEYWTVYWDQEEALKKALDDHGIKLAIPRQTIFQPDETKEQKGKKKIEE